MGAAPDTSRKIIASNRKALHDYAVLERIEAGLALRGTEVKSLRAGSACIVGSFARVKDGDLWVCGLTIPPYEFGNVFNHEPTRPRRLLLHRREIGRLQTQNEQKGCALIPLCLYLRRGLVKMEIGVCRGKRQKDKRETLRRRTADREAERAIAAHR